MGMRRAPRPDIFYISRRTKRTSFADGIDESSSSAARPEPPRIPRSGSSAERPYGALDLTGSLRDDGRSSPRTAASPPTSSSVGIGLTLRRTSPAGATSAPADYVTGSPPSLNLDRRSTEQASLRGVTARSRPVIDDGVSSLLFPAPGFASGRHLSEESPVVRLNSRQAGIGTLLISGAHSAAWEGTDLTTGAENLNGQKMGTTVSTRGNRPLVAFHEGSVAVALRHVHQLRRAIFIAAEAPLVVRLFDEAAAAVLPPKSNGEKAVLYMSRIAELLELRAEYVADTNYEDIWAKFGFRMTTPVNIRPAGH